MCCFGEERARAIDFDDSGFGYFVYDLSLALEHCQEDTALPQFRDALLEGYNQVRLLPADQIKIFGPLPGSLLRVFEPVGCSDGTPLPEI